MVWIPAWSTTGMSASSLSWLTSLFCLPSSLQPLSPPFPNIHCSSASRLPDLLCPVHANVLASLGTQSDDKVTASVWPHFDFLILGGLQGCHVGPPSQATLFKPFPSFLKMAAVSEIVGSWSPISISKYN